MYKSLTNLFDVTLGYEDITFSINDTMLKLLHRKKYSDHLASMMKGNGSKSSSIFGNE